MGTQLKKAEPMLTVPNSFIRLDENGTAWLGDTGVKVIHLVREHIHWHWEALQILQNHPDLTLAQIHAALSYYYEHQAEFNEIIEREEQEAETFRQAQGPSPFRQRIRKED